MELKLKELGILGGISGVSSSFLDLNGLHFEIMGSTTGSGGTIDIDFDVDGTSGRLVGGGGTLRTGSLGELLADAMVGRSFAGRGINKSAGEWEVCVGN